MNGFDLQQRAEDHYRELVQLAQAGQLARASRPVRPWRLAVGRALVSAGVGLGLPRTQRARALVEARELLCPEGC